MREVMGARGGLRLGLGAYVSDPEEIFALDQKLARMEGRKLDEAKGQMDTFLRTGEIVNLCAGGDCSFPELSGCAPDEQSPVCPD